MYCWMCAANALPQDDSLAARVVMRREMRLLIRAGIQSQPLQELHLTTPLSPDIQ